MKQNKLFIWAWLLTCVLWTGCDDSVTVRVSKACDGTTEKLCVDENGKATIYVCENNSWTNISICKDGGCNTNKTGCEDENLELCTPEDTQCTENGLRTCSKDSKWSDPVPCQDVCEKIDGVSQCVSCSPGSKVCDETGMSYAVCDLKGEYGEYEKCGTGLKCLNGDCVEDDSTDETCTSGDTKCEGNILYSCDDEKWHEKDCEEYRCVEHNGGYSCTECENNSFQCNGNNVQKCTNGFWEEDSKCDENKQCENDTLDGVSYVRCADKCESDESRCVDVDGKKKEVCEGGVYHLKDACEFGCTDGECLSCEPKSQCVVKVSSETSMVDDNIFRICEDDGSWGGFDVCDDNSEVSCSDINAQCTCSGDVTQCASNGDYMLSCKGEKWVMEDCPEKIDGKCAPSKRKCVDVNDEVKWAECLPDEVIQYKGSSSGDMYKKCDENGVWSELKECDDDNCKKGYGVDCVENDRKCVASKLVVCYGGEYSKFECKSSENMICNDFVGFCQIRQNQGMCVADEKGTYAIPLKTEGGLFEYDFCGEGCYKYAYSGLNYASCDKPESNIYALLNQEGKWSVHPSADSVEIACNDGEMVRTLWQPECVNGETFKCMDGVYKCSGDNKIQLCTGGDWSADFVDVGTCPKGTRCDDSGNFVRCVPND